MSGLRQVWKYAVPIDPGNAQHAIPEGALLLDLQMQQGVPTMWWSVPTHQTHDPSRWPLRTFTIVGTGPPGYTDNLCYVGTVQDPPFVWHVMSWEPIPREGGSDER